MCFIGEFGGWLVGAVEWGVGRWQGRGQKGFYRFKVYFVVINGKFVFSTVGFYDRKNWLGVGVGLDWVCWFWEGGECVWATE
jgi:hypothetical protein